jgi:hypothetical protein
MNPPYVNRGGELVYAPPFIADNVQQYGFLLDADITKLQALCDRYLNKPLGQSRFVPGGPFVMPSCCILPSLRSSTPPYSQMGWFAENEIAFWILIIDKVTKRMYWMLPYIWVDDDYAFAMGRELYGFFKGMGTITLPESPDDATLFAVDTLALKTYSPDSKGEIIRLVRVNKVEGTPEHQSFGTTIWGSMKEFVKSLLTVAHDGLSLLGNMKLIFDTMEDLVHLRIPMVFLKQFRDVTDPATACFQEITEAQASMTKFHSARILKDAYDINIEICDSHPIRTDLGLAASGPLRSKISFWVNYDFEIGLGTQTVFSGTT